VLLNPASRVGISYAAIAKRLNAEGITGKQGGTFYASTIWKIAGNDIHGDLCMRISSPSRSQFFRNFEIVESRLLDRRFPRFKIKDARLVPGQSKSRVVFKPG